MIYDGEYFLLLEDIFNWVIVHITLNFQFLIKRNHAFINLFPLFNLCSLLTYKSQYFIPLFQNTETIHGNFRARVTVFTSAMKRTLNTFMLLIMVGCFCYLCSESLILDYIIIDLNVGISMFLDGFSVKLEVRVIFL